MADPEERDIVLDRARAGRGLLGLGCPHGAPYRDRLRRMVALRLDRRLQGRVDPSDVLQEAYPDAAGRLAEYARDPAMPFFLWLRFLVGQRLAELHRHHLGAQARDAGREVSLYRGAMPETTSSASLAALLLGRLTSPSQAAIRAERQIRLQEALNGMDPIDREVLALRHFEQLTNAEAAQVLGLEKTAASNRYVRALKRLKDILAGLPGRPGGDLSHERRPSRRPRPDRAAGRGVPRPLPPRRAARASTSTPRRYPELADEIRELFPALVDAGAGKPRPGRRPTGGRREARDAGGRRPGSWATTGSSARSAAAAWASSTRRCRSRWAGTWP